MAGQIGVGFLNPVSGVEEILKARESISESSKVTIT